jgi:hypothetical protein
MANTATPQSEAAQIAEIREALRLQELDAVEREQELENIKLEVFQLRKEKQEMEARQPVNLDDAVFIMDGNEYQFTVSKLNFGRGEILNTDQMINRPDILRRLVKSGSTAIKLITH